MKLFWLYILLFISILSNAQKKISFVEEYIDFKMDKFQFEINGIYIFSNLTNQKNQKNIIFPFALNTDSVEVIRVYNLTDSKNVDYKLIDKGITFKIELNSQDTISINIAYKQTVKKENTYILRSTTSWGDPLKIAKYTLSVNDSLIIDSFSYQPDSISDNLYFWNKIDFMPERDFKIWLKLK